MKDFKFKIDGTEYAAQVEEQGEGKLQVTLNGKSYSIDVEGMKAKAPKVTPVKVAAPQPVAAPAPKAAPAAVPAGGKAVTAPLPGTITTIKVAAGQAVKKGDVVVIMEAMKMANEIQSEWDGTVSAVNVQQGASVNVGDALITIA